MCYKQEKYRQLEINLVKKMKDVPEFIKNFFNRYKSRTSRNCYWGYIKDLLMWLIRKDYIKKNNISEITESDINKISSDNIISYLEALEMGIDCRKNSLESINSKKKVFNSFWEYMETEGYVDKNVVRHISNDRFKSEKTDKEVKIPTQEEIDEFLTNISKGNNNEFNIIRNLAIVNLFLGSGIRSEELINLDIPDLFLHEDKPYIKVLGKGNIQNYDNVPISEKAKDYLLEYLEYRTEFVKLNKIDNNAVFLSNSKKE